MSLRACRVVLERPHIAANIGAAARVMRNFGLADLALVAPVADPDDPRGLLLATHAEDILQQARVVPELADAVGDCLLVVGTSARTGGLYRRQSIGPPEEILLRLLPSLERGPCALVFGPEPSGLTNAEVTRCHHLIHIPTDDAAPALNLAQAVAVCLYELRRAWLRQTEPAALPQQPAPFAEQEQMFEQLRGALEDVHFLYGDKADALMHAVRHLIGRAQPSAMEVGVLLGLARQLRWVAERAGKAP
jgi:tRNA/rRNA methyltransferase